MKNGNGDLLKDFSAEQVAKLDAIIARHKGKPGCLIPVLEEAQVVLDYLPMTVQKRIADGLNLPLAQVYGVVTFYSFFTMKPRGRHTVRVCLGTACYVRGGKAIAESIIKDYKVHEFKLNCIAGEKVCFGAWVRGNDKQYWGVGHHGRNKCTSCCYTCQQGFITPVQNLNE